VTVGTELPVVEAAPAFIGRPAFNDVLSLMRGAVLTLYVIGAGPFDPPLADGVIVPLTPPYSQPVLGVEVTLTVGSVTKVAEVLYAGAAPGLLAGVLQVNFRVPGDTPTGANATLVLHVGNAATSLPGWVF
jgi:uncharacterized protein (TIGR03437 family)